MKSWIKFHHSSSSPPPPWAGGGADFDWRKSVPPKSLLPPPPPPPPPLLARKSGTVWLESFNTRTRSLAISVSCSSLFYELKLSELMRFESNLPVLGRRMTWLCRRYQHDQFGQYDARNHQCSLECHNSRRVEHREYLRGIKHWFSLKFILKEIKFIIIRKC